MDTEMCSDRVPRCRDNLGIHLSVPALHVEKAAALTQHKEIQARECDPVTTSNQCCVCCHNIKMCPLFLQPMVGACPVACPATSTGSTLSFVIKSRKIFPTEKASTLPEKDDTCLALSAATAVSHASTAALLQTAG